MLFFYPISFVIENIFLKKLKGCKILEVKALPLVNINHRFGGPHPMHFEDIFYEYKMNLLNALIKNLNNEEVYQRYKEVYEKSIDEIKNKVHLKSADCKSSKRVD